MMPKHSSRAPWGRRFTALMAVSLLTLGACSDSEDGGVGPSSVETVQIVTVPNGQTLTGLIPGNKRKMLAVPTNSKGNFVDRTVTFASSDAAVFTVTGDTITAIAGGTGYLRATAGGQTDSIAVGVRFRVATVTVTPANPTLRREGAAQMTATLRDASTAAAVVTGRPVTWTSSDPAIATVSATGLVTVQANPVDGSTVTITATATNVADGGVPAVGSTVLTVTGDAVVSTVTVAGGSGFRGSAGTVNLSATAASGLGNVITTPITWSTSSAPVATVSAAGVVTFEGGAGPVTITATATGAGSGGANVAGTTSFDVALNLSFGDSLNVPTISEGSTLDYAIDGGIGPFQVRTFSGTSGDNDMYVFAPGVSSAAAVANNGGGSGWTCRPWLIGSNETCTIAAPVAGWYRVRHFAYIGDGDVVGMRIRLTPAP